ncbi:hypothetical protein HAX54_008225, partial [Datura stramonium]|nr:hypothetical protein [Datura stramonium]
GDVGMITSLAQAYVELREDLKRAKRKWCSGDKLFIYMWKGIKQILKTLFARIHDALGD